MNRDAGMDWEQVRLNGGPPCFFKGADGPEEFCGRARRWEGHGHHHDYVSLADLLATVEADNARYKAALEWYAENARLCRLIHKEGDVGRNALAADGGKIAREALTSEVKAK